MMKTRHLRDRSFCRHPGGFLNRTRWDVRIARSPSPRPYPSGRGRIVRRPLVEPKPFGSAQMGHGTASVTNQENVAACPLSPRERVRGNLALLVTARGIHPGHCASLEEVIRNWGFMNWGEDGLHVGRGSNEFLVDRKELESGGR